MLIFSRRLGIEVFEGNAATEVAGSCAQLTKCLKKGREKCR